MNLQSDVTVTREYGGYLPLELPKGQEYYRGEHVVALNSGRYAIVYALLDGDGSGSICPVICAGLWKRRSEGLHLTWISAIITLTGSFFR